MKVFSLKNLKYLRWIFALAMLITFTAVFSGMLGRSSLFNVTRWQFLPRILCTIALSGITTISAMMIVAIITSFCGRIYCSWICPLGLLQELLEQINHRFFRKKPRRYHRVNPVLRVAFFSVLIILFFSTFAIFLGYLEPYSLFGKSVATASRSIISYLNTKIFHLPQTEVYYTEAAAIYLAVACGIILALAVLVFFKGRIFCNTICPTGTLLAALASRSGRRLNIQSDKCVQCGKCEALCNANCINVAEKRIDFINCFMCLDCVANCPTGAIKLMRRRKNDLKDADVPQDKERRNMLLAAGLAGFGAYAAGKVIKNASTVPEGAIAPPGAGSVEAFLSHCTGCGLCISNCRGGCLQPATTEYGWKGFMLPTMKFSGKNPGKCEYECSRCSNICPTGALRPLPKKIKQRTRIGMAHFFPDLCVAYKNGKDCGACGEHCPTGALKMVAGPNNAATIPDVITDLCIGCGNCEFACPVKPLGAIRVKGAKVQDMAVDPEEIRKQEPQKEAPSAIPF